MSTSIVNQYGQRRDFYLHNQDLLLDIEHEATSLLASVIKSKIGLISRHIDFGFKELFPFWNRYIPRSRGRAPIGDNIPAGDLGEKVVGLSIFGGLIEAVGADNIYGVPSTPFGGDYRVILRKYILHIDIKSTGPRDDPLELVVPPNQVTGDGAVVAADSNSVSNNPIAVGAKRENCGHTNPTLTPLAPALIDGNIQFLPQLTLFAKFVYRQEGVGQPLDKITLATVPNGILLFDKDGIRYYLSDKYRVSIASSGIRARPCSPFNFGKDDRGRHTAAPNSFRFRIKLPWLKHLDRWRVQDFYQ